MSRLLCIAMTMSSVACAHTQITTNDPRARIYVDGEYVGRGETSFDDRTGLPGSMVVTAKTDYGEVKKEVSREFTMTTFVAGLLSYFTGFLWAWQYPENVVILLQPEERDRFDASSWNVTTISGWERAPSRWDDNGT